MNNQASQEKFAQKEETTETSQLDPSGPSLGGLGSRGLRKEKGLFINDD